MAKRKKSRSKASLGSPAYYDLTQRPLQVLLFLLPLIVLYELGVFFFVRGDIEARAMLKGFFQHVGIGQAGYYLPGIVVIVLLLTMHFVQREPWKVYPRLLPMMGLESLVLALPILLFAIVFLRQPAAGAMMIDLVPLNVTGASGPNWQSMLVYSVGAGIYEELLFRVIGIALIHALCIDLLALPKHVGELTAIGVTALLFAFYHFMPFRDGVFSSMFTVHIRKTIFYLLAGVYLACIYVYRGFGIVAGAHAVYDVMVVTLAEMRGE
jgi:membrane protease YdiL (CAAX protease family)